MITTVILPCVMLFQSAGEYFRSEGSPINEARMLREPLRGVLYFYNSKK